MSGTSPSDRVQDIVVRADQRRRSRDAVRLLARCAPMAAGAVLLLAFLVRIFSWSTVWPLLSAGVLGAALVAVVVVLGRRRAPTDAIAARVDDDATLRGELRSAHWFAGASNRDAWADYHLDKAADRADGVDWTALYPPVRAGR